MPNDLAFSPSARMLAVYLHAKNRQVENHGLIDLGAS